jgi:hypothetical protein
VSPTELTLKQLRAEGYTARVVERWNQYARVRQDCFGFDVLACKVGGVQTDPPPMSYGWIVGVQACAAASHSARRAKLLANPEAAVWVASGGHLAVWSWSTRRSLERTKAGKRSKRLVHHLRREEITLAMFVPNQPAEQPREAMT